MSDLSGVNLLKTLKGLKINLLGLDDDVINGWFDTDDQKMKNLLEWMCTSLSPDNYVSPLLLQEYESIETSLSEEELDIKKSKHSDIFDQEFNALEVEFIEQELESLQKQQIQLNAAISSLNAQSLKDVYNDKSKEEIEHSVRVNIAQENCHTACVKLDLLNKEIQEKVDKCEANILAFQYNPTPLFINNMALDIDMHQEKIEQLESYFNTECDETVTVSRFVLCSTKKKSAIQKDTNNQLNRLRKRISCSERKYADILISNLTLTSLLNHLETFKIETVLSLDSRILSENITEQVQSRNVLYNILVGYIGTFGDKIGQRFDIKYLEEDVKRHQITLSQLQECEEVIKTLLSHYEVLQILHEQEKNDFGEIQSFIEEVLNYVNKDMNNCVIRTKNMENIIREFNEDTFKGNLKLSKTIMNILSQKNEQKDCCMKDAFKLFSNLQDKLDFMEKNTFGINFDSIKLDCINLRISNKTLRTFLMSNSTHRLQLIHQDVEMLLKDVEEVIKKEIESIKNSVESASTKKKSLTERQIIRRQLWMHFYTDPSRLKVILNSPTADNL